MEPVGPRLAATALGTAEVVVVPAVAVARDGVRLGRGGGWYDRALRHARPGARVVALVFDDELVDTLRAEAHDPLFPAAWADRLDEFFADVTLTPLPDSGHFVPLEAPDAFATAVRAAVGRR